MEDPLCMVVNGLAAPIAHLVVSDRVEADPARFRAPVPQPVDEAAGINAPGQVQVVEQVHQD